MKNIAIMSMIILSAAFAFNSYGKGKDMAIKDGSKVAFDYSLTVDGAVVDTSEGRKPLEYTQGDGRIIPGLTKQMAGLKAGDEKVIDVTPEEGYGVVKPALVKEIPISTLPKGIVPQPGMKLNGKTPEGRVIPFVINDVKKDTVIVDLNHPLAGKMLTFRVKILSVN